MTIDYRNKKYDKELSGMTKSVPQYISEFKFNDSLYPMTQCSVDGVERPLVKSGPQFDTNRQVGVYEIKKSKIHV